MACFGQLGDEVGIQAVVGQTDRHVGLAAAEGSLKTVSLDKAQVVIRLQAQHQFAKGDHFFRHMQWPP